MAVVAMQRMISLIILIVLVALLAILFYQVMIGFLLPLFLAALLAILFQPLHRWIVRLFGGYERLAAAITTALILVIVLVPLAFVLLRAATEATAILSHARGQKFDTTTLNDIVKDANEWLHLNLDATNLEETARARAGELFGPIAAKTPGLLGGLLINTLVTVLSLYYFLADGQQLMSSGMRLFPLDPKYQEELVGKFVEMTRAVTSASLVAAMTQGILLGIGFYFAGMHGVFLLTILTMLASFIPLVGSSIVWGGSAIWLFFAGKPTAAILVAVWSLAVAVAADNFVKPLILQGQAKLHPLLALLSVLGGVQVLGPLGIFFGPMAVSFLQAGLTMLNTELRAFSPADQQPADDSDGHDSTHARSHHRKTKK
jgi:predicted PurR-regulated permease PerM